MADNADVQTITHKIDHSVRKIILAETRTLDLEEIFYGFLIGDETDDCCEIISCIRCTNYKKAGFDKTLDWINEIHEICSMLPTGLKVCGVCYVSKNNQVLEVTTMKKIFSDAVTDLENELINKDLLLWLIDLESAEKDKAFIYSLQERGLQETIIHFNDITDEFLSKHMTLRLTYKFEVSLEENIDTDIFMTLAKNVTQVCNKLPSATFYFPECRLLIGDAGIVHDEEKTCGQLLQDIVNDDQGFSQGKFNKKSMTVIQDVLNVHVAESLSKKNESYKHKHVPVLFSQKRETSCINIGLVVDLLVIVALNTSISRLSSLFIRGIKDQLQAILTCFETYSKGCSLYVPKVYHFKTPQAPYLTTCIYPWKEINGDVMDASEFETQRSNLLKKLLLPSQRPTLHPNNNYLFQNHHLQPLLLINPHERLTNQTGADCCVAVVDGRYSYHHYMQDNFDDNKWGCAYRSLQTICSWFKHQGYTEKQVPTHRAIQEALVAIGDKQSSFIGSKKWIGSFEVSLCLEYFHGVTSKIMAVNTGAELQSKGRELIHHFQTQGTPVMIGGGVLAHTILGVSFNDKTGEIKFLILDPHYTGGEDLKIILDKGWCGWKNHNFWNQQAHYNMCMPQRPIKV